ncbi:MAG: condensation domain-containing protein, partial [Chloroflexota bacterium]
MKDNVEDIYPLSPMQAGMLFHSLYDSASRTYFEQMHCALRGKLNVAAFERAWQKVTERHPILRTAFVWEGLEEPLQVVQRQVELPLMSFDWRDLSRDQQEAQLDTFLQADKAQGFALSQAPLMRLALMQTGADTHYFVWSHHHLLLDGWSLPLLLQEVFAFYEAHQQGQAIQPESARPYRDYIAWLQERDAAQAESFWRRTLKGFAAPTPLVVDRKLKDETEYAVERTRLSAEITSALQSLARAQQVTLSTILQGAWAILLHRYSGEEDVVFGATVSGRPADLPGAETMVG